MANPLKSPPLDWLGGPIVDPETGMPTHAFLKNFQEVVNRVFRTLNTQGEVQKLAPISGRTEGVGTTVQNLNGAGKLNSLLNVVADRTLANVADDAGSDRRAATANQKTGGDRGFNALDTNNRLANSFRANGVNTSSTPTGATTMSNDGVSTAIVIAASISQFAPGTVSYNSGSVDPGSFGKVFAVFDDASYAGGAVSYQALTAIQNQTAAEGRNAMGSFTTTGGAAKTGGGNSGGTGGTRGGRGYPQ